MVKYLAVFLFATVTFAANAAPSEAPATQDAGALVAQIEEYLRLQAVNYTGTIEIAVDAPRVDKLAACEQTQVFLPVGQKLRPRLTVGVRCVAPQAWVTYTQVSLGIQGVYYVPARNLKPGESISMNDLAPRQGDLLRLSPGVAFDPSQLVGHIAIQRITAGTPIKSNALRSAESIQRGQTVRLEARGVGFVATSEGQAMQNGGPGARIKVRSSSGQLVSGTVLDGNTVLVMM